MHKHYLKIYFLLFFVGVSINIYSQPSQCLEHLYLKIEKDGFYPQTDNFAIYFMCGDSIFRYDKNAQICVDSGVIKQYTVFFYYYNRIIQSPVFFEYPDAFTMMISYYKITDINIATNSEIKKYCIEKKIKKKNFKNTDVLYFGDALDDNSLNLMLPAYYWNKERINVNELYYGIVRISIGRCNFIALDYKPPRYRRFW